VAPCIGIPLLLELEITAFGRPCRAPPERFDRSGRNHGLAGGIEDAVGHLLPEALVHPVRTAFTRIEPDGCSRIVELQCACEFFRASYQIGNEQEIAAHRQQGDGDGRDQHDAQHHADHECEQDLQAEAMQPRRLREAHSPALSR
jgi:hypothetical protein